MEQIDYNVFSRVEIISGTVIKTEDFPRARKPAYKVWVDFGKTFGTKKTSAQIVKNYSHEDLIGKKVMGCLSLGTRNIAGFVSEFLLLGFEDETGSILLPNLNKKIPNGKKLH